MINPIILDSIKQGKETKCYTHVKNADFEMKYSAMDNYLILLWIHIKPNSNYKGIEVFKALIEFTRTNNLPVITAFAARRKFRRINTNGYYSLLKWGFIPDKGISFINKTLGSKYTSIQEAYSDQEFLKRWKEKGAEFDGSFEVSPTSFSMQVLNKL